MRIRKPAVLNTGGIIIVSVFGLFGGYYIWKPLLEEQLIKNRKKLQEQQNESNKESVTNEVW